MALSAWRPNNNVLDETRPRTRSLTSWRRCMRTLEACPNKWNAKQRLCQAIIETPKGRRNKFDYDPEFRMFKLGGLLPEGMAFPFDFGFIPSTLADDGDPLDVMVLMD